MVSTQSGIGLGHVFKFLDVTAPDYWFIDLARLLFAAFALITALFALQVGKNRGFVVYWGAGVSCVSLSLIELAQIGHSFVPWRLPMFFISVLLIAVGVRRVFRRW